MKLLAGTSGYAFKEWKGAFYPKELKDDGMLGFYASKFPAVEINNTFYRLPKENVLREWAAQVPETFTFAVKASQRITHHARLKEQAADTVDFLLKNTSVLGERLGPILFQLPPNLKKDTNRFRGFLGLLPSDRRYVFEFRHESWFDDEIYDAMRERDIAMCIIEQTANDEFQPQKYKDTVRERVLETIQRKVEGQDITAADVTPDAGGKVIDLMEALKASLVSHPAKESVPGRMVS